MRSLQALQKAGINASPHIYLHGRWGQDLTDLRRGSNPEYKASTPSGLEGAPQW